MAGLDLDEIAVLADRLARRRETVGLAVAVLDGGETVFAKGYGVTRAGGSGVPVTPATLFGLGSIAKNLCACLIMRLVERGRLHLDEPLVALDPGLEFSDPLLGRAITLRHVLSHTTGLPAAGKDFGPVHPEALREFVRRQVSAYRFLFLPGAAHNYSNVAYCLAGHVAEVVTGSGYDTLVAEHVFEPLGMHAATFDPDLAAARGLAPPHRPDPDGSPVPALLARNASGNPSSFTLASLNDLCALAAMYLVRGAVFGERYLWPQSLDEMMRAQVDRGIGPAPYELSQVNRAYGLGFYVGSYRRHRVARHGGVSQSYNCFFELLPDDGRALVVLCNHADDAALTELVAGVYDVVTGRRPAGLAKRRAPGPAKGRDLSEWTGTYVDFEYGGIVEVMTRSYGGAVLRRESEELEIVPLSGTDGYARAPSGRLPLALRPRAGADREHVLIVGGRPYLALEQSGPVPTVEMLQRLAGRYRDPTNLADDGALEVTVAGGALKVSDGGEWYDCRPLGGSRFTCGLGVLDFDDRRDNPYSDGGPRYVQQGGATLYFRKLAAGIAAWADS